MNSDAPDTSYNAADLILDPPESRVVDDEYSDVRNIDDLKRLSKQLSMRFIGEVDDICDEYDNYISVSTMRYLDVDDRKKAIARFLNSVQPALSADEIEDELEYCQYHLEMFIGFNQLSQSEDEQRISRQLEYTTAYVRQVWNLADNQDMS
jgi:hypothetical protein